MVEPNLETIVFVIFLRKIAHTTIYLAPYSATKRRAERKHYHIIETGLTMLFNASAPANAFTSATYIINRLPSKILAHKSPFEMFHSPPNYDVLRVFGCRAFPYLRNYSANNLAPRNNSCIFIGSSPRYKDYRCLDPASNR